MGSQTDRMGFTGASVQVTFDGLLFDMDGTIIDSTAAVEKHWHTVGTEIGVDPEMILQTSHGRRSIDMLKVLAPEKANWEYVRYMEGLLPKLHGADAVEIPGARALLDALISCSAPWAIVTSGTVPLVTGWLGVLGLPKPEHMITAESVAEGKPHPGCYLLGRERLGLPAVQGDQDEGTAKEDAPVVLVLEDSPAGIRSGKAAGCQVLGVVTSHTAEQVVAAGPDWIVKDLASVKLVGVVDSPRGKQITLELENLLVTKAN